MGPVMGLNTLGDGKVKIWRKWSSNKSTEHKCILKVKPCILHSTDGESVTRAIWWLARALEGQVYLNHFCHGSERCSASFRSMKIVYRDGTTWFSGGLGSVRFMVGLGDLKGLFQPKRFCDSMILIISA